MAGDPEKWRLHNAATESLYAIGRLKSGFTPDSVQARLTVELQQWLSSHREVIPDRDQKDIPQQHIHLTPAAGGVQQMQTDYATGLQLLLTLSGLLLLIGCANIANLLLARGSANRPQIAVRLALGAARKRLIRQMLTESLLLAIAGGLAGLYVAYVGAHAILLLAFRGTQYVPIDARPSLPVLGFALLVSLGQESCSGLRRLGWRRGAIPQAPSPEQAAPAVIDFRRSRSLCSSRKWRSRLCC